jgi:hypothetical protein
MIRKITMWTVTALLVVAFAAPMAFALSPEQQCAQEAAAAGAEEYFYSNTNGVKSCTYEVEGRNPKFSQETTESQQGRIGNQGRVETNDTDSECSEANPGNSCPGGQF